MQFVKSHWISLLCGAGALIGIALAVIGMTRNTVVREMEKRVQAAAEISALRSDPQNDETIKAEQELGQKFEEEYKAVLKAAESINQRQPLLEGVFPRPAQLETQYRFKQVYSRRIYELPRELKAGWLPSEGELQDETEIVADLERRKRAEEGEETASAAAGAPSPTPPAGPRPPAGPPGWYPPGYGPRPGGQSGSSRGVAPGTPTGRGIAPGMPTGRGAAPGMGPPPAQTPAGPLNVQQDVVRHRATVKKARSIRVYALPETSFHISPILNMQGAPSPRDMWYAQVSLWVQEDLVKAIARLNEDAAQQVGEKEDHVQNMPVKRIESIHVLGYVTPAGLVPFPTLGSPQVGAGEPVVSGVALDSFTGRKSDEQFDVIRVMLTVVVDRRDLLKLIDAITRTNFYRLIGAEYSLVPVDEQGYDDQGFLYGYEPVIRTRLEFEGYMARKIYKPMMPAEVLQDLSPTQPEGEAP